MLYTRHVKQEESYNTNPDARARENPTRPDTPMGLLSEQLRPHDLTRPNPYLNSLPHLENKSYRRTLRKTLSFLSSQRIQDTSKTRESKAGRRALATYELPRAQSPRNEDVATGRSKDLPTAAPEGLEPNFLSKGALQYQMVDVFGSLRTEGTGII
jgi:hypothetical protein